MSSVGVYLKRLILFCLSVSLLACTEGKPQFSSLGTFLDTPSASNNGDPTFYFTEFGTAAITIRGNCDIRTQQILISTNGEDFTNVADISLAAGSDLSCNPDREYAIVLSGVANFLGFQLGSFERRSVWIKLWHELAESTAIEVGVAYISGIPALQLLTTTSPSAAEGSAIVFRASLNQAAEIVPVHFDIVLDGGSASLVDDLGVLSLVGSISPGDSYADLTLNLLNDDIDEWDETFTASVLNRSYNVTLGTPVSVNASILDDDTATISIANAPAVSEGGKSQFAVSLSRLTSFAVTISYDTRIDSATHADYLPVSGGILEIPAMQISGNITITTTDDSLDELAEYYQVSLVSSPLLGISRNSSLGIILDNDVPNLSVIYPPSDDEGSVASFIVTLNIAPVVDFGFSYTSLDDTAHADHDYISIAGNGTVLAGQMQVTIAVSSLDDGFDEADNEVMRLKLISVFGTAAEISGQFGYFSIRDNEVPGLFISDSTPVEEGENSLFTVSLNMAPFYPVTFKYTSYSLTTNQDDLFTVANLGAIIPAGQKSVQLAITTRTDGIDESAEEYYRVSLSNPSSSATIAVGGAQGTIQDELLSLFVVDKISGVEEGQVLAVIVTLNIQASEAVTFNWKTIDGMAQASTDFIGVDPGIPVTLLANARSVTLFVPTSDDAFDENPQEHLYIQISNPSSNALVADNIATANINDNDIPILFVTPLSGSIEGEDAIFNVSLDRAPFSNVQYSWTIAAGTVDFPGDVALKGTRIGTLSTSQWRGTITIALVEDLVDEPDESFLVSVSASYSADSSPIGSVTLGAQLLDNDSPPSIWIGSAQATEGSAAVLGVSISGRSAFDVQFHYYPNNGTASFSSGDYPYFSPIARTIPAGSLTLSITIATSQDALDEENENFSIVLDSLLSVTGGDTLGEVTIVDNDGPPTIWLADASVNEGGVLNFSVTLSAISGLPVTFQYSVTDGTAVTSDSDYLGANNIQMTIAAGSRTLNIAITTTGDSKYENNEVLNLTLSGLSSSATVGDTGAVGTLVNEDSAPSLFISNASGQEGTTLIFAVSLSAISGVAANFQYSTVNDTASSADGDFIPATSSWASANIAAGARTLAVAITTTADSKYEADEVFTVTLTSLGNAVSGVLGAVGTILNDEALPSLWINDVNVTEGGVVWMSVSLSALSAFNASFNYSSLDGAATNSDSDYRRFTDLNRTIPAGSLTLAMAITTLGDSKDEPNEEFDVTLTSLVGALGGDVIGRVNILDDDLPPSIWLKAGSNTEGSGIVMAVSLSEVSGWDVAFNYSLSDGTASIVDGDYVDPGTPRRTILAGTRTIAITIASSDDSKYENAETIKVTLTSLSNLAVGDTGELATILNDDDEPFIFISDTSATEAGKLIFAVTLSSASGVNFIFSYSSASYVGGASSGSDFTAVATTIRTLVPGAITMAITIQSLADVIDEQNELFWVTITSAEVGDLAAIGTIIDDDSSTLFIDDPVAASEGDYQFFVVTLSLLTDFEVSFDWKTLAQTATATTDFASQASFKTATISAGVRAFTIPVLTTDDTTLESAEYYKVTLANVSAIASEPNLSATGWINDEDVAVSFINATNPDGTYSLGSNITIIVGFTGSVLADSSDYLGLNTSPNRQAWYSSGSGSTLVTFVYQIASGDQSSDLNVVTIGSPILRNDGSGEAANIALSAGILSGNRAIVIDDSTPNYFPTISGSNCLRLAYAESVYSCQLEVTGIDSGETASWTEQSNSCNRLALDATSGRITGTPGNDEGICNISVAVSDGANTSASWTVQIETLRNDEVSHFAAGGSHFCAVLWGEVKCWGANNAGQIGDNTTSSRETPTKVGGGGRDLRSVAGGLNHSCAVSTSGKIYCWGQNTNGQLGLGITAAKWTPTLIVSQESGAHQLGLGSQFSCSIFTLSGGSNRVKCWGQNSSGQLGDGTSTSRITPVFVKTGSTEYLDKVSDLAVGNTHACALDGSGAVWCWGSNTSGELGTASTLLTPSSYAARASVGWTFESRLSKLVAGSNVTCGLSLNGKVYCWGSGSFGKLGSGTSANSQTPSLVDLGAFTVANLSMQYNHGCAAGSNGAVKCWGSNSSGQLGLGSSTDIGDGSGEMGSSLASVDLGASLRSFGPKVQTGYFATCAQLEKNRLKCWGSNSSYQLGQESTSGTTLGDGSGEMGSNLAYTHIVQRHRAFVTATQYRGNFGGIDSADNICVNAASSASRSAPKSYRAILGDSGTHAIDHVGPIYKSVFNTNGSGSLVATYDSGSQTSNLFRTVSGSYPLNSPIKYDESGTTIMDMSIRVWTNSRDNGEVWYTNTSYTCSDWTSSSSGLGGVVGDANLTNYRWLYLDTMAENYLRCDQFARLYCIGDE